MDSRRLQGNTKTLFQYPPFDLDGLKDSDWGDCNEHIKIVGSQRNSSISGLVASMRLNARDSIVAFVKFNMHAPPGIEYSYCMC